MKIEDEDFEWYGENISRNKSKQKNYESCTFNGMAIKVGDCVLVRKDDVEDPTNIDTALIAKVIELYDRGTGDSDSHRASVIWYERLGDIPVKHTEHCKGSGLYTLASCYYEDIDVESVFSKCVIYNCLPGFLPIKKGGNGIPVFAASYQYNKTFLKAFTYRTENMVYSKEILYEANYRLSNQVNDQFPTGSTSTPSLNGKSPISNCISSRGRILKTRQIDDYETTEREETIKSSKPAKTISKSPAKKGIFSKSKSSHNNISSNKDYYLSSDPDNDSDTSVFAGEIKQSQPHSSGTPTLNVKSPIKNGVSSRGRIIKTRQIDDYETERKKIVKCASEIKKTVSKSPAKKSRISKSKSSDSTTSSDSDSTTSSDSDDDVDSIQSEDSGSEEQMNLSPNKRKTALATHNKRRKTTTLRQKSKLEYGSLPSRIGPCRSPKTPVEVVRTSLQVGHIPSALPCREAEFDQIYSFLEGKLMDGTGGCMYVSGVPGTGKTVTVQKVIKELENSADIPKFIRVDLNGMRLSDPHQAYVELLKGISDQKATAKQAAAILDARFSSVGVRRDPIVLILDELDQLCTRRQGLLYNLLDWPTRPHSRLIIVAIANTIDLPERIFINRVSSRLGLTRVSFHPYTHQQLLIILKTQVNKSDAFEHDALVLIARKVAAVSGDARRALDICRRAAELAVNNLQSPRKKSTGIGVTAVNEAIQEMFSSPKILAVKEASYMEQIMLRAVIAEFHRTGLEECTFSRVCEQHNDLCRLSNQQPLSVSQLSAIVHQLGALRILLVESGRLDNMKRIRLNASVDEVLYAITN